MSVWVCWNAGTLAGALVGGGLGDPRRLGLDAMFPAAFSRRWRRSCRAPFLVVVLGAAGTAAGLRALGAAG